MVLIDEYRLR